LKYHLNTREITLGLHVNVVLVIVALYYGNIQEDTLANIKRLLPHSTFDSCCLRW